MAMNQAAASESYDQINTDIDQYLSKQNKAGQSNQSRFEKLIAQYPAKVMRQLSLHEMMMERAAALNTKKTLINSVEFKKAVDSRNNGRAEYIETLNAVLGEQLAKKANAEIKKAAEASINPKLPAEIQQSAFATTAKNLLAGKGVDVNKMVQEKIAQNKQVQSALIGPKP